MRKENEQTEMIDGLAWEKNWRIDNGEDSYVIPFPTVDPANIVFHGEEQFDYGHYGIHLGQEDRLTFLGPSSHKITANFIDCRSKSRTLHQRLTWTFRPTSQNCLCIPPGVAHAFDSLEGISTINAYRLYLPDPNDWVYGQTEWAMENDIINIPMDVADDDLPALLENTHEASDIFYHLIGNHQRSVLPKIQYQHPFTEDVTLDNGRTIRLLLREKNNAGQAEPEWTPIEGIDGAGWARHLAMKTGPNSGIVPLVDPRPMYMVDHGETEYFHDAYGIHLGQEDRLTFLGPSNHKVSLTLADCREGSRTLHDMVKLEFSPDPLRYLVIPNGVAHRFSGLEKVYTVNRPLVYANDENEYEPGNDVIDWPAAREYFPKFDVSRHSVSDTFYRRQAEAQRTLMLSPAMHATPMILLTKDSEGNPVRVALRKRIESNMDGYA